MSDELQRSIATLLSIVPFLVVFGAVAYRVGNFSLLPGEPLKILYSFGFGFLAVLGIIVVLEALPPAADSVVFLIGALASIGSFPLLRRRQEQYIRNLPPDQRAEAEKRAAFFRSGRGRALFVAFGIGLVIWAATIGIIVR
ncbi:MAG: hypothetical protein ACRDE9_02270 [Candidatus Limnocylindria bacterium]